MKDFGAEKKDLLLYVADADAEAFLKAILEKPKALAIRDISFDIWRHPGKDAGMVQTGAELARRLKGKYQKSLLVWDHHGSGRERRQTPETVQTDIQRKLDSFTWASNSAIIILIPELEEWLWHCENALLAYWKLDKEQLQSLLEERSQKLGITVAKLKTEQPKELFEHIMRDRLRRTISPRDFAAIGKQAGIDNLRQCKTFCSLVTVLRDWFAA